MTHLPQEKAKYRIMAKNYEKIKDSQNLFTQEGPDQIPATSLTTEDRAQNRSFIYRFAQNSEDLPRHDQIIAWMKSITEGSENEHYPSQKPAHYQVYSRKIVGREF